MDLRHGIVLASNPIAKWFGVRTGNAVWQARQKCKELVVVELHDMFRLWQKEAEKLNNEEITQEEYNAWRYTYPQQEVERTKAMRDALRAEKNAGNS